MSDYQNALAAGHRLWVMAQGDSHQSRHVARLVLGLFNGQLFPFDLTRLRGLDERPLEDCFAVLNWVSRTNTWMDEFLGIPSCEFEALAKEHGLLDAKTIK